MVLYHDANIDGQLSIIFERRRATVMVRTTVHLDESVIARVRRRVPQRGLSRFVNEAVAEKIATLERQETEAEMIEGYKASAEDQRDVDDDWRTLEADGWPK
jgi:Arc/MetJ family transcription regulator